MVKFLSGGVLAAGLFLGINGNAQQIVFSPISKLEIDGIKSTSIYGKGNEEYQLNNAVIVCSPKGAEYLSHLTNWDPQSNNYGKEYNFDSYAKCTEVMDIIKAYATTANPVSIYLDHDIRVVKQVEFHWR